MATTLQLRRGLSIAMLSRAVVAVATVVVAAAAPAQARIESGPPLPTGSALGPHRRGELLEGCGRVGFTIRCDHADTQRLFDQGIAQLHGGAPFAAERSFRQVAAREPNCAMAYWGVALANADNPDRASHFMEAAILRRSHAAARGQRWIDALAAYYEVTADGARAAELARAKTAQDAKDTGKLTDPYAYAKHSYQAAAPQRRRALTEAIEQIVADAPDDIEAIAMLAHQHTLNRSAGVSAGDPAANLDRLERALADRRSHPAQLYLASRLLQRAEADADRPVTAADDTSARVVRGAIFAGPAVASRWRICGEILARLHRHRDAAIALQAAARLEHARMQHDFVLPYEIRGHQQTIALLGQSLIHTGQVRAALDLGRDTVALPRHPELNDPGARDSLAGVARTGLIACCVAYRMPETLARLEAEGVFDLDADAPQQTRFHLAADLAGAWLVLGDTARSARHLAAAGGSAATDQPELGHDPDPDPADTRRRRQELHLLLALAERRLADARAGIAALKLPSPTLPAWHLAELWLRAGDAQRAVDTIDQAAAAHPHRVEILCRQVEILHRVGHQQRARDAFAALRLAGGRADHTHAALAGIAAFARDSGCAEDWRTPGPAGFAGGSVPDLAAMGPDRWQPIAPHDWELRDSTGRRVSLAQYRGRPLLVIVYLGFGCLHCVEQLQNFHPLSPAFRDQGIELAAIGLDTVAGARKSLADLAAADRFAFPLISDRKLRVFREWQAFDDFERMPLHGTFLLDRDGRLLWQDINHLPFAQPQWLLAESQRLLARPRPNGSGR